MKKILKEEAIDRLKKHNPNITLIGEYTGLADKTNFKCNRCGNVRFTSLTSLLESRRKLGCLKCEKRKECKEDFRTKSHEQYELEVYDVWGDLISLIGKYNGGKNKIEAKCNKCNLIWNPEAKALLTKHGCPKCGHERNRNSTVKKHDVFVKEVAVKHNNRIIVIGTYVSNSYKILFKCNKCQHEWLSSAGGILKGRGCPICNLNKGETLINNILVKLNINFKPQYIIKNLKTTKNGVPIFDFAIFDENNKLNTIIEYDGKQHFKSVKAWGGEKRLIKQQKVDDFKNKYCIENNIKLIRIKYTELKNINTDYIKNKLYEE